MEGGRERGGREEETEGSRGSEGEKVGHDCDN